MVFNFSELQLSGLILKKEKKKEKERGKNKVFTLQQSEKTNRDWSPSASPSSYHVQQENNKKKFLTNSSGICMFCVFFNIRYVLKSVATVHLLGEAHK